MYGHRNTIISYPTTYQKEMTKKISGKHLLQTIGCDLIFLGQKTLPRGKHANHFTDGKKNITIHYSTRWTRCIFGFLIQHNQTILLKYSTNLYFIPITSNINSIYD